MKNDEIRQANRKALPNFYFLRLHVYSPAA